MRSSGPSCIVSRAGAFFTDVVDFCLVRMSKTDQSRRISSVHTSTPPFEAAARPAASLVKFNWFARGELMISQTEFNNFVEKYNEDYIQLLRRASMRQYYCLISAFLVLKDFYDMIHVMYDRGSFAYEVLPYPFSFRSDEVLLKQLGFDEDQIIGIFGFLDHVQATQGKDFEACLEAGISALCAR
jgi:hypothetical protein